MPASATQKVLLWTWTLLFVWPSFAAAFVVVLKNESGFAVIPCIQQANGKRQFLDPAGAVPNKGERVYDNARSWLRSSIMDVKEKNDRTVSLFFLKKQRVADCGNVTLSKGTVEGNGQSGLHIQPYGTGTETGRYTYETYAQGTRYIAWVIAPIDDSGECSECGAAPATERYYADGPRETFHSYDTCNEGEGAVISVQACNTQSGQLEELVICAWLHNGCKYHEMNNRVGCKLSSSKTTLFMQPCADFSTNLPDGKYSGLIKIRELISDPEEILREFYVNVEIEKK